MKLRPLDQWTTRYSLRTATRLSTILSHAFGALSHVQKILDHETHGTPDLGSARSTWRGRFAFHTNRFESK